MTPELSAALVPSTALLALSAGFLGGQAIRNFRSWLSNPGEALYLYGLVWSVAVLVDISAIRVGAFATSLPLARAAMHVQVAAAVTALGALTLISLSLAGLEREPGFRRRAALIVGAAAFLAVVGNVVLAPPATLVWDALGLPQRTFPLSIPVAIGWCVLVVVTLGWCVRLVARAPVTRLERWAMGAALFACALAATNDVLLTANLISSAFIFQYCYLAVNLAVDLILGGRMVRLQTHLQDEVVQRTRELAERNRTLADALARAEAAGQAQAQFVANMSHEIRTPMNGILGMTRLVLEHETRPVERERLQMVRSSAEVLLRLLNDLLDLARMDAGRLVLEVEPFDPRRLVEEVVAVAAPSATRKGLHVSADIGHTVPGGIRADRLRLRQVLVNLVDNAVKFTERGEVVVRVDRGGREEGSRGQLRFEVVDTGPGIPEAARGVVFEPFQQGPGPRPAPGGVGLGLAISRELVHLMGGEIGVGAAERGSVFWFTLPFGVAGAAPPAEPADASLVGFPVLLADPHPGSARAIERLLEGIHAAVTVADSREALLAARATWAPGRRGLLVLDASLVVPTELPSLRASAAVCLVLESDATPAQVAEARDAAGACVVRPVRRDELLDLVARIALARETTVPERTTTLPPIQPLRVLVAEDHVVNRRLVVALLERAGHHVTTVEDGLAAVGAYAPGRFDMLLLDLQMPGLDGVAAARRIRAAEPAGGPRVPILAISAGLADDAGALAAAGVDGFVGKPVRMEELHGEMVRVLPPVAEPTDHPVLDLVGLRERVAGDEVLLRELVILFLEDLPGLAEGLRETAARGDLPALARAAHRLKGAAANLGAEGLRAAVTELERVIPGPIEGVTDALRRVEAETNRLGPVLDGLLVP